jgi:hypothetical protein
VARYMISIPLSITEICGGRAIEPLLSPHPSIIKHFLRIPIVHDFVCSHEHPASSRPTEDLEIFQRGDTLRSPADNSSLLKMFVQSDTLWL